LLVNGCAWRSEDGRLRVWMLAYENSLLASSPFAADALPLSAYCACTHSLSMEQRTHSGDTK
jgi:hypothetical protein